MVAVNGIRMYVALYGAAGRPLVLLHGGAGNGEQFSRQIPEFARRHRLIVPDMRSQGRSGVGPAPLTYRQMAEDVVTLLDSLHVARADVMGWSDGGITALDLALHHPDRVRRIVTFGANFTPDGVQPGAVAWNDTARAEDLGPAARLAFERRSPEPGRWREALNQVIQMWKTQPKFTPAELGAIRAPALVCAGEHDLVRAEHTAALARAIPGATLWIVPGADHGAILERPELVNPRVLAFLDAPDPPGATR